MRKILLWLFIIFLIGIIFLYWFYHSPIVQRRIYPLSHREEIIKYSNESHIDPHLVMGIIWVESKFEPGALSSKDAKGLMQILPDTGAWIAKQIGMEDYREENLYDPKTNIMLGCWYFSYLTEVFNGDEDLALAAYNGGMGNVRKWLKDDRYTDDGKHLKEIPFKETSDYLDRVKEAYQKYKNLYEIK